MKKESKMLAKSVLIATYCIENGMFRISQMVNTILSNAETEEELIDLSINVPITLNFIKTDKQRLKEIYPVNTIEIKPIAENSKWGPMVPYDDIGFFDFAADSHVPFRGEQKMSLDKAIDLMKSTPGYTMSQIAFTLFTTILES